MLEIQTEKKNISLRGLSVTFNIVLPFLNLDAFNIPYELLCSEFSRRSAH